MVKKHNIDGIEPVIKIGGRSVTESDILSPVTYVPTHANGNAGHKDCELGVLFRYNSKHAFVLYNKSRTVQVTNPDDLVWG